MSEWEIPTPEGSDPKEIYAFFGLTMYNAQVFEKGMLNLVVLCKMLGTPNASRTDFDNYFEAFDRKTLGQLLRAARTHVDFNETVDKKLDVALERRNFLAHQYFWHNATEMMTDSGRLALMLGLRDDIALFKNADLALDEIASPLRKKIGLTDEILQAEYDRIVAKLEPSETAG